MTTRKPKPAFSPLIEWPTEPLQLVVVTVEHKAAAGAGKTRQIKRQLSRSLPRRGKVTLH